MLYRLVFSLLPAVLLPRLGFSTIFSIAIASVLIIGTISGNKEWIPQLQTLTLLLIYAIAALGYMKGQDIALLQRPLTLIAFGYLFLGTEGLSFSFDLLFPSRFSKVLAILSSVMFGGFVAAGISILANAKMGFSGILISVFLMTMVVWQDVRKILQHPSEKGE
ncbi:hypothetical protein [Kosmotoga pacifica]|uniref:Uncharacterized protein n=1 Tax=Kosmotoga pacifica TaxID=1330330 RepID=A0A0G2Z698_9BACT|nr:hypothetical protein [Kosmotoga pacifica]AKI97130.1 hypothetical protein IX53_04100 [Kosmotoga pacifica]